jgi:hypothetical protein
VPPQLGFLLADGRNGPFKFEVQYVRGVRDFDPKEYKLVMQEHAAVAAAQDSARQLSDARAAAEARAQLRAIKEDAKLK